MAAGLRVLLEESCQMELTALGVAEEAQDSSNAVYR